MKKIIAVDHGNRMVKTVNHAFASGFMESGHLPHNDNDDILLYDGKEYIISDKRLPQQNDKTKDENFFILTLFAIGKDILSIYKPRSTDIVEVELLLGLPPLHFRAMKQDFEQYFTGRGRISFVFNKTPFTIEITRAYVYYQAFAAVYTVIDDIEDSPIVNVVDIGGHTIDCMQFIDDGFNVNLTTSLEGGINLLIQGIDGIIRSKGGKSIPDVMIEGILQKKRKALAHSSERTKSVRDKAREFANSIILEVSQAGFDLREYNTVFVGGGSMLLKDFLMESENSSKFIFVDDLHANARGYKMIYDDQER